MNSNVINARKNSPSSYQSQIMNAKNLLRVLIAKVKVRREYFQVLPQLHLKRLEDKKNFISPLSLIVGGFF
jgi:hypothetical protein